MVRNLDEGGDLSKVKGIAYEDVDNTSKAVDKGP
jgi:hypothetical protein